MHYLIGFIAGALTLFLCLLAGGLIAGQREPDELP